MAVLPFKTHKDEWQQSNTAFEIRNALQSIWTLSIDLRLKILSFQFATLEQTNNFHLDAEAQKLLAEESSVKIRKDVSVRTSGEILQIERGACRDGV